MDKLRIKLYLLITEKADYNEVLKTSQKVDVYISKYNFNSFIGTSNQSNVSEKLIAVNENIII